MLDLPIQTSSFVVYQGFGTKGFDTPVLTCGNSRQDGWASVGTSVPSMRRYSDRPRRRLGAYGASDPASGGEAAIQ